MVLSNRIKQILSFVFCFCSLCSAAPYTLKDLKSLASNQEFQEYFNHAKDIPPHKRDREWETLTTKAFVSHLDFLERTAPLSKESFKQLLELNQWKILRNDEVVLNRMNTLLKDYLISKLASEKESETLHLIKTFWSQNFENPTLGFSLGKALLKKDSKNLMALQMLSSGFLSSISDVYCGDEEIYPYLMDGLENLYQKLNPNEEFDVKLASYMNRKCWNSLKPKLISGLENPKTLTSKKQLFLNILTSDFSTESEVKSYAQFLYLIDGPQKSKTLNQTWSLLENLKKDPEQRENILNRIKNLDSLPDRTFKDLKNDQTFFLARSLIKSFPEFADSYSDKCLSFLEGKNTNNPTLYCQNFYRVLRGLDYKTLSPLSFKKLSVHFKNLQPVRKH